LLILSALWTFFHVLPIALERMVLRHADGYRKETFRVERVICSDDSFAGNDGVVTLVEFRADGTINGIPERLSLWQYLPSRDNVLLDGFPQYAPKNQTEAEAYAKPGQEFVVHYNPHVTSTEIGMHSPRVIKYDPAFPDNFRRKYHRHLLFGPGILVAAVVLFLAREVWKGMNEQP